MKKLLLIAPLSLMIGLSSCVSKKKYMASQEMLDSQRAENTTLEARVDHLSAENKVLADEVVDLNAEMAAKDKRLAALRNRQGDLVEQKKELQKQMIASYTALRDLQKTLADALVDYPEDEVRVYFQDGQIHLQLANNLMFPSGSTDLKAKGEKTLDMLAGLLKENADMDIVVEGHTDDVPVGEGAAFEDNWDLSVLRATHIVRVLEDAGVDPKRITPAGRSKYEPVATNDSDAGRSVNRRTEIIIEPDLTPLVEYWMGIGDALGVNH